MAIFGAQRLTPAEQDTLLTPPPPQSEGVFGAHRPEQTGVFGSHRPDQLGVDPVLAATTTPPEQPFLSREGLLPSIARIGLDIAHGPLQPPTSAQVSTAPEQAVKLGRTDIGNALMVETAPLGGFGIAGRAAAAATEAGVGINSARLLGLAAEGASVGGAFSALDAAVRGDDPVKATLFGVAGGTAFGTLIGSIEAGTRALSYFAEKGTHLRTIQELEQELPQEAFGFQKARQTVREARAAAARTAYQTTLGERTDAAAREAAKTAAKTAAARIALPDPVAWARQTDQLLTVQQFKELNPLDTSAKGRITNYLAQRYNEWITTSTDFFNKNAARFGTIGPKFAQAMNNTAYLAQRLEAQYREASVQMLKRMTQAERLNFTHVVHGAATPMSARVAEAAQQYRAMDDLLFKQLKDAGVKEVDIAASRQLQTFSFADQKLAASLTRGSQPRGRVPASEIEKFAVNTVADGGYIVMSPKGDVAVVMKPLQYRGNHAPVYYTQAARKQLAKAGSPMYQQAFNRLKNVGYTDEQANKLLHTMFSESEMLAPHEIRSTLQWSRELSLPNGWETDPLKWMPRYIHDASRRLASAHVFGGGDELYQAMRKQLDAEGGDTKSLDLAWRGIIGRTQKLDPLLSGVITASTPLYLGFRTGLLQFYQMMGNTAPVAGLTNTFRAMATLLKSDPQVMRLVRESGALLPSLHMNYDAAPLDNFSALWVKGIFMGQADKAARAVAAVASGLRSKELAAEVTNLSKLGLENSRKFKTAARQLEEWFGLSARDVIAADGQLTTPQIMRAMNQGANGSQFASEVGDLPIMRNTAAGKFVMRFRTFSLQQSKFFDKYIVGEMRKGNFRPALNFAAAMGVAHGSLGYALWRMQNGDKTPELADFATSVLMTGAVGAQMDMMIAAARAQADPTLILLGPGPSAARQLFMGGKALVRGDFESAWHYLEPAAFRQVSKFAGGP